MKISDEQILKQDERRLLQKASQGDREAYAILYNRLLPKLYQFIFPFTANSKQDTEDILQEVFLKIWEKKEMLLFIKSFEHYTKVAVKNKLLNTIKHNRYKQKLHQNFSLSLPVAQNSFYDTMQFDEYNRTALVAIKNLPDKRKQIFQLRTQEDLSLTEISTRLGISKSRVKQQLYTANDAIISHLRKHAEWLLLVLFWWK